MRRRGLLLVAALLAACRADRITTEDPPAVSFDAHAWRGSTSRLVSDAFDTSDSLRILLGGAALPIERLDSVTLVAQLPDTTGTFVVQWESGGRSHLVGSLTLHGKLLANRLAPVPDGTAMAWPYGAGTFLAGVGGRLMRFDPFSGALGTMFADSLYSSDCGWGPWPAGGHAVVLVGPTSGTLPTADNHCRARVVRGDGVVVDTLPNGGRSFWWPTIRLADGSWAEFYDHTCLVSWQKLPGGGYLPQRFHSTPSVCATWRVIASPDGVYAFGADGFTAGTEGLAIVRGDMLDSLASVRAVTFSHAAAFSESGDTLVVQPELAHRTGHDSLFVVRSLTGATLAAVPSTLGYSDLAFDSGRPWLYAASVDTDGVSVTLAVYDLRTMRVATVLHARGLASPQVNAAVYLSLDVWHRRLNALLTSDTHNQDIGAGFSFELMP